MGATDTKTEPATAISTTRDPSPDRSFTAVLQRFLGTLRSDPAGTLAIILGLSLWAAVTGLIAGWKVALFGGLGAMLILVLEAADNHSPRLTPVERRNRFVLDALVWITSIIGGLLAGIATHRGLGVFSDYVRLWLSSATGIGAWSAITAALRPSLSRPTLAEYETIWLARATTIGVAVGAFRALIESLLVERPSAGEPLPDVFGNATDTVGRATFGIALFGGVLFMAIATGTAAGHLARRLVSRALRAFA